MRSTFLAVAMATAITASPAPPQYHTLSFTVENNTTVVTANLISTGKDGSYVLQAERPSVYQGSKLFFTGSADKQGLNFLPNSLGAAGASVPKVGEDYGYAAPITVQEGSQGDVAWDYNESTGRLYHDLDGALETFFACSKEIDGKNATVLSWGVPQNAKEGLVAPDGCQYTDVRVAKWTGADA